MQFSNYLHIRHIAQICKTWEEEAVNGLSRLLRIHREQSRQLVQDSRQVSSTLYVEKPDAARWKIASLTPEVIQHVTTSLDSPAKQAYPLSLLSAL